MGFKFFNWRPNFGKDKLFEETGINHKQISRKVNNLIGIKFKDDFLLIKSLTHKSKLSRESLILKSYERLEFLGDSVLDLIVGEYLFTKFPTEDEGFLTKTRSKLVDKAALSTAADRMNLHEVIIYDEKYISSRGKGMRNIEADCLEALIGAMYLDRGYKITRDFVNKWMIRPVVISGKYKEDKNFKGQLLEYAHSVHKEQPTYQLLSESGPEHDKVFKVAVSIGGRQSGFGTGKNKKEAEQLAAKDLLEKINSD